jgi:hypothetical protein
MAVMHRAAFSERLRRAIERSGKTRYQIWQDTNISQSVLSRFMAERRGLSLANIDVLCEYLQLDLVERTDARKKATRKSQ